jgi:hypothetical protein
MINKTPFLLVSQMESLLKRMTYAKDLMAIADSLQSSDCDQAQILATSAETILKRVNEGLEQFLNSRSRTISITEYEELIAGTAELNDPQETLTVTTASANARHNFTAWATSLNLQSSHLLYFGDVLFRLAYDKGRATLSTQTRAGKTIVGYSPSGAIKAYLKSIGSLQANVDGWKRMTMITEKGESHPIGWSEWVLRVWDIESAKFKMIDE